jgi:hypothetical protein
MPSSERRRSGVSLGRVARSFFFLLLVLSCAASPSGGAAVEAGGGLGLALG